MVDHAPQADQEIEALWQSAEDFFGQFNLLKVQSEVPAVFCKLRHLGWELKIEENRVSLREPDNEEYPARRLNFIKYVESDQVLLKAVGYWDDVVVEADDTKLPDRIIDNVRWIELDDEGNIQIGEEGVSGRLEYDKCLIVDFVSEGFSVNHTAILFRDPQATE